MNLDILGAKLKRAFPATDICLPIQQLGEGYASEVVETTDGLVFKLARNHIAQDSYNKEQRLLLFLSVQVPGVRIPYPEYYLSSSADFPFGLLGYRKIEGVSMDPAGLRGHQLTAVAASLANFLLHLHSIDMSLPEIAGLDLEPFPPALDTIKQTWINISGWLRANLADEDFNEIRHFWQEAEEFWELNGRAPVLTHGDLWRENILLDQSKAIAGIIDFGSARVGDPAIDFAVQESVSDAFRDEVIEHYVRLGGNAGTHLDQRMAYLLALREFYGLEYGLMTRQVNPDSLKKIVHVILKR